MESENAVRHNAKEHRFELHHGTLVAAVHYEIHGGTIVFTHTAVPPEMEGKGVAGLLARTALDYARGQRLKVVPQCTFMAAWIERHPEYQDLVEAAS